MTPKTIRYSDHGDRERRDERITRADVRRTVIAGTALPTDRTGYHIRRGKTADGRPLDVVYREGPTGIYIITVYIVTRRKRG